MFVQAEKFLAAHQDDPTQLSVFGQELNESTWRMAKMNLAIHGLNGNLGPRWGDTFSLDYHTGTEMDFVMANPPFNISDWNRREGDSRWAYAILPAGNANYAWLQHIISHLAPGGTAGVVMANGSMTSNSGGEGEIRAQLVENDLVACMVALPEKLFRSTGIPVCLWFFAKDKVRLELGGTIDRRGEVLFIDARQLGHMVTRAERAFSDEDIAKIADTYHAWRGTRHTNGVLSGTPSGNGGVDPSYVDVPGFCHSVPISAVKEAAYVLTPGRYVGLETESPDQQQIAVNVGMLVEHLARQFEQSEALERTVKHQLGEIVVVRGRLGDLLRVKHGFAFDGAQFDSDPSLPTIVTPGNFAVGGGFKASKVKTYSGVYDTQWELAPGSAIISMTDLSKAGDTLGSWALVPSDGTTYLHNQRVGLARILPNASIDLRYLAYRTRLPDYRAYVIATATGTTVRHTSPGRIESFLLGSSVAG